MVGELVSQHLGYWRWDCSVLECDGQLTWVIVLLSWYSAVLSYLVGCCCWDSLLSLCVVASCLMFIPWSYTQTNILQSFISKILKKFNPTHSSFITVELLFISVSKPAPEFQGTAVVNGEFKDIKLSDYKGKYLVLLFYPLDL